MQPEARCRHEHARAGDADTEVAAQGQIGRPAVNAPVEGAEGRQREAFNLVEKLFETMIQSVDDGVDGVTRAESLVTCAGDYYGENAAPHRDFAKLFAHYPNVVGIDAIVLSVQTRSPSITSGYFWPSCVLTCASASCGAP